MSTSITCQNFFDGVSLHGPHRITYLDGLVQEIEPFTGTAEYFLISPGLVDIQMNGFDSVDCSRATVDELHSLGHQLEALGTTSWLATITTAPLDNLSMSVATLDSALSTQAANGCEGIHIEGPFLGSAAGAHRPDWIIPFDDEWVSTLPPSVRLMTIAAEQPDVQDAVLLLRSRNIEVSIGHSRPNSEQWNAARAAGARVVTHLFNGMSGVHHRDDGLALSALVDEDVFAGLIGDMIHVSPKAVALAFRAKGSDRICLVSDSVGWTSTWAQRRGVELLNGAPRLSDGTLAGSSTPLSECVRRVVKESGVSLADALRSATSVPATAMGLPHVGHVTRGKAADLVAFDDSLHVVRAWRRLVSLRG